VCIVVVTVLLAAGSKIGDVFGSWHRGANIQDIALLLRSTTTMLGLKRHHIEDNGTDTGTAEYERGSHVCLCNILPNISAPYFSYFPHKVSSGNHHGENAL
jgi:hypothetical protein